MAKCSPGTEAACYTPRYILMPCGMLSVNVYLLCVALYLSVIFVQWI
jgi:hypothetical protein